jgi:hypothetical protein
VLRSVQSGSATLPNGGTTVTVALAQPVTLAQAFLVFSASLNANTPNDGNVSGQLTAANQITFQRTGTTGAIAIEWYVADFASGVSVRRGTADLAASGVPFNQALAPAVNAATSFPIISYRANGNNINSNDFVRATINGGGANLELARTGGQASAIEVVEWQVVEYANSNVRSGTVTFTATGAGTDLVQNVNLGGTPIANLSKAWLLFTYDCLCDSASPDMGSRLIRGTIPDVNTLTFDRSNFPAAGEIVSVTWYLVEFTDQTMVRHGSQAFGAAESARIATLPPVTPGASIATAGGYYHRGGRTSFNTDDDVGSGSVALDLINPIGLSMTRGVTGAPLDVGWFVVSFVYTNYRSIGTDVVPYATGQVTVTPGSNVVTGSGGALWATANRGRGDVINILGVNYTIYSVDSETELRLTEPYAGALPGTFGYGITRQFNALTNWEDCIDGGTPCGVFPAVTNDLLNDGRSEVGIAYEDGPLAGNLLIDLSITDAAHTITLTADGRNRNYGRAGQGVLINNAAGGPAVRVQDDFVTVEWLEIASGLGAADGIQVSGLAAASQVVIQNNLIHNVPGDGIEIAEDDGRVDLLNNIIYASSRRGILFSAGVLQAGSRFRVLNNTVFGSTLEGIAKTNGASAAPTLLLQNNISHGNTGNDYGADPADSIDLASSGNLSEDGTAGGHSPADGGHPNIPLTGPAFTAVDFISTTGPINLHLQNTSYAIDKETALSSIFTTDIDAGTRSGLWDIGADEFGSVTSVTLVSFEAQGRDSAVELTWETASEIDNLGFHLYRSLAADGPYDRVTERVIPGLGSSPVGARYRYVDSGLENGTTYFYRLEDIETTGRTKTHGPAEATPSAGAGGDEAPPEVPPGARLSFADPEAQSLVVERRNVRHLVLELRTGGFYAEPQRDGSVRLSVPGFVEEAEPGSPAIPVRRSWIEIPSGPGVKVISVREEEVFRFRSLRPMPGAAFELIASQRGTVRAGLRPRAKGAAFRAPGLYPEQAARVISLGYQGATRKALIALSPLRYDRARRELVLAKRLVVVLALTGREQAAHRESRSHRLVSVPTFRLVARANGLYRVSFEELRLRRALPVSSLRLSRLGDTVPYHLEPDTGVFAAGSSLYFVSEGASLNPYGTEAVYELEIGRSGETMAAVRATVPSRTASFYWRSATREENRLYQSTLLEAEDLWLWDPLFAPVKKSYAFEVSGLQGASLPARLEIWLQGGSDFPASPDHHVVVAVNGVTVAEGLLDGKKPFRMNVELSPGVLKEGSNEISVENLGDTGALYSMVLLDRFTVHYPRKLEAEGDRLEGTFSEAGIAEVSGLSQPALVLDVTERAPRWVRPLPGDALRFVAEADHRYTAVGGQALLSPEIRSPVPPGLRSRGNRADYLVVGPHELLQAAEPLLALRRSQGLASRVVSLEEVYSEFGFGESRPEAIREFLSYAYHHWRKPAPRYVLLLGDASYDFKDYLGAGARNLAPAWIVKTSYLWTASDAAYASVNGDDVLPDLAIGRLPASSAAELRLMVEKILAYESAGSMGDRELVLVADNSDAGGDFEGNAEEIASSFAGQGPERIYLSRRGAEATRGAIVQAFDDGASVLSYMGHGGIQLWAQENVFDVSKIASLAPQETPPLVLTLNCLNGFFHFPYFDSLSEELVKAEGKGAIAALSPSGLSLDGPAHVLHKAVLGEVFSGRHLRLGDALVAAQASYAAAGAFPELLAIYNLLGDPALTIR